MKKKESDLSNIKLANREKILRFFIEQRDATKQLISNKTGISIPTVTHNVKQLIDEGIIIEAGLSESTGGRYPALLRFCPDSRFSFGVEFRSKIVRVILTNLDSEIKADTSISHMDCQSMDEIVNLLAKALNDIVQSSRIDSRSILGIGFSIRGTVEGSALNLEKLPNLPIHTNFIDFKKYQDKLGYPIFIENDANVAALAELRHLDASDSRHLLYVLVTTGIGCGIVIKEQLYRGKNKRAGEVGHMTIASEGNLCRCGSKDCWELYASESAFVNAYRRQSNNKTSDAETILLLVRSEDSTALAIWNDYLDKLAIGIRNLILIHDPSVIVIGGRISMYEDILIEPLKSRLYKENGFLTESDVTIKASILKENASILGAARMPFHELLFHQNKIIQ